MALVGYGRVSSADQRLEIQLEQLEAAGCTKIFAEKQSGTNIQDRKELDACLQWIREGDTLIVTRIDRMARSVVDFHRIMALLDEKKVDFRCLLQPFDTTSATGKLMRDILAAFAEFETVVRKERQREGIEKARAAGVYEKHAERNSRVSYASRILRDGATYAQASEASGIPERTLRRRLKGHNQKAYKTREPVRRQGLEPLVTEYPTFAGVGQHRHRDLTHPPSASEEVASTVTPETPPRKTGIFAKLFD